MANAPAARVCSFSSVVETPLVSASPIAGNGRRGGSSSIRASVAATSSSSKTLMPSDDTFDLQQEAMMIKVHTILHQRRREGDREMLVAIDKLRRLCIDHYFQEEIKSAMGACVEPLLLSNDLHDATLAFRLLREAGHDVSANELLRKFTDDDDGGSGEFSLALSKDIRGLLSLHDVSQLNVGGETLLYKAKEFSTKHLTSAIRYLEPSLAKYVRQALDHPYHRSLMQYKARHHLSYLQSLPAASRDTAMEELAVAEFQFNKQLHQIEMQEVKRWWMEVGLAHEIPVIRDQLLKWYMWAVTVLPGGSSMSRYRVEITKIISFVYVVDDIFDVVGTPEELSRFTDAIKMWDIAAADSLPTYMRSCYKALYTVTNEIAEMAKEEHGFTNSIDHLKKAWATLFDGFMVEARWLATDEVSRAEEYLRNGVVTSGVPLTFAHISVLLGHGRSSDNGASYNDAQKVVSSLAKILRLYDDLGSAEDEAQEGLDGSYRDFYLMENPSCTPADAEEHMRGLIAMEWEELNRECLGGRRSSFPSGFTQACLNGARMVSVMYGYNQEQRLPVLEDYMRTLLL